MASSICVSHASACSREAPHISSEGLSPAQKAGRCGEPKTIQRNSSSNCTHGTPAGLPFGIPGRGEVMEGAMQQAAQEGRQFIGMRKSYSSTVYLGEKHPALGKYGDRLSAKIPSN